MARWRGLVLACFALQGWAQEPLKVSALTDLSLEELSRIRITSVSRRAEPLNTAAASVFVITNAAIARSGANTLAEALRLAPNLDVVRLDASQYAISARGFNTNIANKLLVLVDGRTVYSPLFSGVFWDASDVMLEDVDRIEVISGPAGSLWGTNAVNGVINVITRTAADTRGTLATVSAGDREQAAAARYGRKLGEAIDFRVYAKAFKTDAATEPRAGASTTFERQQAGFRSDWKGSGDRFTLQGDLYQGQSSARQLAEGVDLSGANLLGRWTREHADGSSTQLRTYLDQTVHRDPLLLDENGTLFDVDLRHQRDAGPHRWVLGGGYRHAQDDSDAGTRFAFIPARRSLNWANVYAQDQIALTSRWDLTLGTRFERNDYTGWEVLPNARLGWKATPTHFLWTAISRAVRAPSRIEREIVTPPTPPFLVTGSPDFQSEIAKVFELGMRGQPMRSLSYSATLFRQRYDSLKSAELAPTVFPITTGNKIAGTIDGLEAWAAWQATPAWRLIAGGTHLHKSLHNETGSSDPVGPANLGNDPDTHWIARSVWNLRPAHELDVALRHSSSRAPLPPTNTDPIPAYTGLDMRYAWSVTEAFELALIGTNLLDPSHREWGDRTVSSEIARSVFLRATWKM